jgi:VWFA-related protein
MRLALILLTLAQAPPDFRSELALLHADVEVLENNTPLDTLRAEDFSITVNGKLQTIVNFGHAEESLDVLLLLDTSDSMRRDMQRVASVARTALAQLHPGDRAAVMAFDCTTALLSDFTDDMDEANRAITRQVLTRPMNACSYIQKALGEATAPFRRHPQSGRRAILIITDDAGSESPGYTADTALRRLREIDAVVVAVITRPSLRPLPRFGYKGARRIAEQTGGDSIATQEPGGGLAQMLARLRSRYSLYYRQPDAKPGPTKVQLSPDAARRHPAAHVAQALGLRPSR